MASVMFSKRSEAFCCLVFLGTLSGIAEATTPAAAQKPDAAATSVPQEKQDYGPSAIARPATPTPLKSPFEPKYEPIKPNVIFSKTHASTCLKLPGDVFPPMVLKNMAGNDTELSKWYGERLTLIVFWNTDHVYATEQFRRLADEVSQPFAGTGIGIVAIHVGPQTKALEDLQKFHGGRFASLVDPNGKQFAKVATGKLPRSYLLDAEGQIVWMDIEYSRSTQRELENAIHFYLRRAAKSQP